MSNTQLSRQVRRHEERRARDAQRPVIGRRQPVSEFREYPRRNRSKYMPHTGAKQRAKAALNREMALIYAAATGDWQTAA